MIDDTKRLRERRSGRARRAGGWIARLEELEERTLLAATIGVNFTGLTLTNVQALAGAPVQTTPPDPSGAVNGTQYAEFVNGAFAVFDTSSPTPATPVEEISDGAFWVAAGLPGATLTDGLTNPRVLYDSASSRWFAIEETTAATGNSIRIAVSASADATKGFSATSYVGDPSPPAPATGPGYVDLATLSMNADSVLIGTNNYTASGGTFTGVSLASIPKADLIAAPLSSSSLANMAFFQDQSASTLGFGPQAATNFGASNGHATIIGLDSGTAAQLQVTDLPTPTTPGSTLPTPTTVPIGSAAAPVPAHQPDGTAQISTGDASFRGNIYQVGNLIYMVDTVGVNGGADTGLQWIILNSLTNSVVQQGILSQPTFDYYDGSIAANAAGDIVIAFTRSGTSTVLNSAGFDQGFAGSYAVSGVTAPSGAVTFGSPILLAPGQDNYHLIGGANEPWGNYSTIAVDPLNPNSFWTVQEFAEPNNVWATQITQLTVNSLLANDDSYTTAANTTLVVPAPGVLANDVSGNGETLTPALIAGPMDGTVTLNTNGSFTYVPNTGFSGTDTFTYQDTDTSNDTSNIATVTITVTAASTAPIANNDFYNAVENTTLNVAAPGVLANDSSPLGLVLIPSVVANPADGTVTLNPDGSFSYVPVTGFLGLDSFTYQDSDGTNTSNVATVTIDVTATAQAPVAVNDSYSTVENTTLTKAAPGVLSNDTSPTGKTLTAAIVAQPTDGTVTLNSNGSFTYVPKTGFVGLDSFTYQDSDGTLTSNVATVTITVTAASQGGPVANDDFYSTPKGTTLTVTAPGVLTNDTSPSGATLTATLVTPPAVGTLTFNSDGSFTYVPAAGFTGIEGFTYEDTAGTQTSNVATVTITVTAPVATDLPHVVGVSVVGGRRGPSAVVLAFSAPLDPTTAVAVGNYTIIDLGRDGRLNTPNQLANGTTDDLYLHVLTAVYDPATFTVTLGTYEHIGTNLKYLLRINGQPPHLSATGLTPNGVSGATGLLLDGTDSGAPGTDFVTILPRPDPKHVVKAIHKKSVPKGPAARFLHRR